jgi:hypothetical protein
VKKLHEAVDWLASVGHNSEPIRKLAKHFMMFARVLVDMSRTASFTGKPYSVPVSSAFPPDANVTELLSLGGLSADEANDLSNASFTSTFFKFALQTVSLLSTFITG